MRNEHNYILECSVCGQTTEQDAEDVDHGLLTRCCGQDMTQSGESYTNEWAKRQNRRARSNR